MRIIAIDYEPSSSRGGQEKSYCDLLCQLVKNGNEVYLLYVIKGDLLEKYNESGIKTKHIKAINIINKISFIQWYNFLSSVYLNIPIRGATIYINQIMDVPLGVTMKKLRGARRLVCHLRLPPLGYNLKKKNNQLGFLISYVDRFIVANKNMKIAHEASGIPSNKIIVIPNAFNFYNYQFYQPKPIKNDTLHIGFAARFEKEKGLKELIYEVDYLLKKSFTLKLSIAGKPFNEAQRIYLSDCQYLIKSLNLTNYIKFVGLVEDPVAFFSSKDVVIMPSVWNEPFGRVLIESLIAGTPVVARDVGAVREIINDPQGEWVYNNTEELYNSMVKIQKGQYPIQEKIDYVRETYDIREIAKDVERALKGVN